VAHGVSRGTPYGVYTRSPGGATETVLGDLSPLRGLYNPGRSSIPRLTPWATLSRPSGPLEAASERNVARAEPLG